METQLSKADIIHRSGLQLDEVMDDLDILEAHAPTPELRAFAESLNRRIADAVAVLLVLPDARDLRASLVARLDQVRAELRDVDGRGALLHSG